jgi:multidrug efflux pump subunit AcrA (membrane-fusion protein)
MKSKKLWIFTLIFVAGIAAMIAAVRSSQDSTASGWNASGFIEADVIAIAPEIAGRVSARPVSEGDEVKQGDLVLKLEDDLLAAQVDLARGRLAEAEAVLAQARAGARQTTLAKAEAQLRLAQAGRDAAHQAWQDAQALRDHPQALDVQIAAAKAQVTAQQKQLDAALLQRDIAEQAWKDYGETSDRLAGVPPQYRPALPIQYYDIPYQWEQALAGVHVAQANFDAAVSTLKNLQVQRSNPQEAQMQVDAAYAQVQAAEAAVAQAAAGLSGLTAGATPEQIDAAQAQVDVARAAVDAAQLQQDKTIIGAPINGVIAATSVHTGELASPALTALQLADLDQVHLTIFVPGGELGRFSIGQPIKVRVDAFPDRAFSGSIVFISDTAEFTPRNVRTPDERVKLVYAVKIKIENPDHALKPGLQAEADVGW